MKLKQLPMNAKLMWESNTCIYPAIVSEHHFSKLKPQCNWRMVRTKNSQGWMEESEYLRYPTEEELQTINWDNIKLF